VALTASSRDFRPTLLVLRAAGLGDLLTIVPAWRGLQRAFPAHHHVIAAPAALAPITQLMDAQLLPLDGLVPFDSGPVSTAVNLHGCGPQSHRLLLTHHPGDLIAFAHAAVPASRRGPDWDPAEHEVQRWCRLVRVRGIAVDPDDLALPAPPPRSTSVAARVDGATTVVHPGAGARARRWPAARWAAVARAERERGRRVVVTGSASERRLANAIAEAAGLGARACLAGELDVRDLAAVVHRAGRIVCGDTGVAHLASAYGTPSVVLFGPTSPARWGPPSRPRHRVLWAGRAGDPHGNVVDPGLLEISTADVIRALDGLPSAARAALTA
jgi:ADP-heptose:LPS heptosyltransferase